MKPVHRSPSLPLFIVSLSLLHTGEWVKQHFLPGPSMTRCVHVPIWNHADEKKTCRGRGGTREVAIYPTNHLTGRPTCLPNYHKPTPAPARPSSPGHMKYALHHLRGCLGQPELFFSPTLIPWAASVCTRDSPLQQLLTKQSQLN